jgi:probable DNA repair protein
LHAWRLRTVGAPRPWSEWTSLLTEALRVVGFPGGEPLDSVEHQALIRWQELMAEFAALERVRGKAGLRAAVARLSRLAASTVFQPEGGDPPLQVLGVLEASGLVFEHLWIMGLTSDAWPPTSRAHPLLPLELQRARRMPGADVSTDLARAQSALERLARSAPEVIASHATQDGDRRVAPSPMIAGWPSTAPMPRARRAIDVLVPCPLEAVIDIRAPAVSRFSVLQGGTSTLKDQAACAFRAFATHRLHADAPEHPHDGLDASERGQLVHQVLAQFWQDLPQRTRTFLANLPVAERHAALTRAAEASLARARQRRPGAVSDALLILERERLMNLVSRWLQLEIDSRAEFEVVAIEERRAMRIGPLELNGRLDRVDRLAGGCAVVIDYKTGGGAGVRSWLGPRPDEPQLPLYLVTTQADACAVAFARVRAGDVRFIALVSEDGIVPGGRQVWRDEYASWGALVDGWRDELTRLAEDFAAGAAEVAPKRLQTCRNCGLGMLCRLNERSGGLAVEFDGHGRPDE